MRALKDLEEDELGLGARRSQLACGARDRAKVGRRLIARRPRRRIGQSGCLSAERSEMQGEAASESEKTSRTET